MLVCQPVCFAREVLVRLDILWRDDLWSSLSLGGCRGKLVLHARFGAFGVVDLLFAAAGLLPGVLLGLSRVITWLLIHKMDGLVAQGWFRRYCGQPLTRVLLRSQVVLSLGIHGSMMVVCDLEQAFQLGFAGVCIGRLTTGAFHALLAS